MTTSLFIILPYPSHYHASFPFAHKLKNEGNEITFVGTSSLAETITSQGFNFLPFQYTSEYRIKDFIVFFGVIVKSFLDETFLEIRKEDFNKNVTDVRKLINEINPTEIFLDEHLAEYYLYILNLNIKTSILCTKIATRKTKGIPPMDSYFIPNNSIYSNCKCEILWFIKNSKYSLKKIKYKIAFLGNDENSFLREYCATNNIPLKNILITKNYFHPSILGLDRVILGKRDFDYPWRSVLPNESFHFYDIKRNEQKYISQEYLEVIENLKIFSKEKSSVIYFSFGTVSYKDDIRVKILLVKVIEMVKKREDLVLVIANKFVDLNFIVHPRIFIFHFVPQLHLLSFCNLMITHGGHNSIKECIQNGVKMLVYPHMENNDQPGNAARVEYAKYGLLGNLITDTVKDIEKKVSVLLS